MSVLYKFFMIPVKDIENSESDFNRFLKTVRVSSINQEFVNLGSNSYWCMSVEYLSANAELGGNKKWVDYKEKLSPEDFVIFAKLREWRKKIGNQNSAPLYTILNNEQLATIAVNKIVTKTELRKVGGIGDSRVKKFGDDIINIVKEETNKNQTKVKEEKKATASVPKKQLKLTG